MKGGPVVIRLIPSGGEWIGQCEPCGVAFSPAPWGDTIASLWRHVEARHPTWVRLIEFDLQMRGARGYASSN